ncbi:hypothetical protein GCM10020219_059730 [Nonomuraea dietziae]
MDDRQRYDRATAELDPPFAILDMEALRANAESLVRRAGGKPIRVASKSVRSRPILERILAMDGFRGVMAFTLPEALWLVSHGFSDVLVAYPTADRAALARLAASERAAREITLMVDSAEHLDYIEAAVPANSPPLRLCLDLDAGYLAFGGRFRAGALRSPVREPVHAADLAADIAKRPGFRLVGLMAYEAQIAGVGDDPQGSAAFARVIRLMQARSARELILRRGRVVNAVRQVADLEFVNGGGTGSIERTVREKAVTECAAGSGFFHPRLFDFYRGFSGRPAALFALPVVRRPAPDVVTVLGGGYLASGAPGPLAAAPAVPAPRVALLGRRGRGRGADTAARPARRGPARRRQGVVPPREGGRAVRAVRRPAARGGRQGRRGGPDLQGRGQDLPLTQPRLRLLHITSVAPITSTAPTAISAGPRLGCSSSHRSSGSSPKRTGRGVMPTRSPTDDTRCSALALTSSTPRWATRFGLTRSAMASTVWASSARVRAIRRSSSSGSVSAMALLSQVISLSGRGAGRHSGREVGWAV